MAPTAAYDEIADWYENELTSISPRIQKGGRVRPGEWPGRTGLVRTYPWHLG